MFLAVRSGDYYMFDDNEEITFLESTKEDSEEHSDDACSGQTPTLGKVSFCLFNFLNKI